MNFNTEELKKYGIMGLVIGGILYFFSLPIMIWKSSRIGRIIFIWAMFLLLTHFTFQWADKFIIYYKNWRTTKIELDQQDEIAKLKQKTIKEINQTLANLQQIEKDAKGSQEEYIQSIKNKHLSITDQLNEIQEALE